MSRVHQQIEVTLAVAQLDVGEAVERVGKRLWCCARAPRRSRRAPTARLGGTSQGGPTTPTTSPRWMSSSPGLRRRRRSPGCDRNGRRRRGRRACPSPDGPSRDRRCAGLPSASPPSERLARCANGGDLVPVGEALRTPSWRTSLRGARFAEAERRTEDARLALGAGARGGGPEGIVLEHRPGRHGAASVVSGSRRAAPPLGSDRAAVRQAALISMINYWGAHSAKIPNSPSPHEHWDCGLFRAPQANSPGADSWGDRIRASGRRESAAAAAAGASRGSRDSAQH